MTDPHVRAHLVFLGLAELGAVGNLDPIDRRDKPPSSSYGDDDDEEAEDDFDDEDDEDLDDDTCEHGISLSDDCEDCEELEDEET